MSPPRHRKIAKRLGVLGGACLCAVFGNAAPVDGVDGLQAREGVVERPSQVDTGHPTWANFTGVIDGVSLGTY